MPLWTTIRSYLDWHQTGPRITSDSTSSLPASDYADDCTLGQAVARPNERFKLDFTGSEAVAYGWPSTGGMLRKDATVVEIEWLGLDRFTVVLPSGDAAEEDA